ncbi:hypothetical protein DPMN_051462 [Dreissena polymorpha]|uniref:Uncharacterized protein n=1 Tax=Dreissena polymorpha TaxID=45954 RepID=A0A9D4CJT9_DREPO|nr:hypothetical protein DPMN_051462 [Dreissena polymorpha]
MKTKKKKMMKKKKKKKKEYKHLAQVGDHETFLSTESDSSLSLSKNNRASVLPVTSYKAVLKHGRFC